MNMTVNVDFSADIAIQDAIAEALAFSIKNTCFVHFVFNGVSMNICQMSDDLIKDIQFFVDFYDKQRKEQGFIYMARGK